MRRSTDISKKHKVNDSRKALRVSMKKNIGELYSYAYFNHHLHHHCWGSPPQCGVILLNVASRSLHSSYLHIYHNAPGNARWRTEDGGVWVYAIGNMCPDAIGFHDPDVLVLIILLQCHQGNMNL